MGQPVNTLSGTGILLSFSMQPIPLMHNIIGQIYGPSCFGQYSLDGDTSVPTVYQ